MTWYLISCAVDLNFSIQSFPENRWAGWRRDVMALFNESFYVSWRHYRSIESYLEDHRSYSIVCSANSLDELRELVISKHPELLI